MSYIKKETFTSFVHLNLWWVWGAIANAGGGSTACDGFEIANGSDNGEVCENGESDEDVDSVRGERARKNKKFRLTEIQHELRRMELMKVTVKMVLDALDGWLRRVS